MYNQGYRPPQKPDGGGITPGAWYNPSAETSGGAPRANVRSASGTSARSGGSSASRKAQPARKTGGGRPAPNPPKKKKNRWKLKLFLVLLAAALIAAGGYGVRILQTQSAVRPYTSVFLDNVYVDGLNLSGMTWDQGNAAVREQIASKLGSWYVRLRNASGEYKDITAETLGISADPSLALEQAWAVGHETSAANRKDIFQLQREIAAAKATTNVFSSVEQSADTSAIDSILSTLEKAAYVEPQDAQFLYFDPESTTQPFVFQSEVIGKRLDVESVKQQILGLVETFTSGEVLIEPTDVQPNVTVAELQQRYALRGRAVTPIASNSTNERNDNIRVAFSKMNGMTLNSGEKFSFNTVVGRRTEAKGFFPAFEYSYGELTEGVGGGVCQASTTVYLAVATAGLKIVKHTSHSTAVSYTEMGKDATVSDTRGHEVDFVFQNNTDGQIFIAAHVITDPNNKKRLMTEVRIYGLDLGDTRYELEAELVETLPAPTEPEIIKDTKAKYVTYTDEEKVVIKASEGYVYDTYLCTIVGGVQTERTKIATSTYKNRAERIYVGVTERLAD